MNQNMRSREWYNEYYSKICYSAQAGSIANKLIHRAIELPFHTNLGARILEVGANQGEHLPFVADDFDFYLLTDINSKPFENNAKNESSLTQLIEEKRIGFQVSDVEKLPHDDCSFDRVIATCLLLHVMKPLDALQEMRRVTKVGGHYSILLPHDPGAFYRMARKMTSLRKAKKHAVLDQAKLVHALEHRNHFLSIKTLIEHVSNIDKIVENRFPFFLPGYDMNLFSVFHVKRMV
jgi:ubiquinone/menaquinone biosynthesis C-methylase UbiE